MLSIQTSKCGGFFLLKKLLITGGVALVGYVINEMRKEYDKNVKDYNTLLDRCTEMSNFIDKCNFYNYKALKANDEKSHCVTEVQTMPDGSYRSFKRDVASGFGIITYKNA